MLCFHHFFYDSFLAFFHFLLKNRYNLLFYFLFCVNCEWSDKNKSCRKCEKALYWEMCPSPVPLGKGRGVLLMANNTLTSSQLNQTMSSLLSKLSIVHWLMQNFYDFISFFLCLFSGNTHKLWNDTHACVSTNPIITTLVFCDIIEATRQKDKCVGTDALNEYIGGGLWKHCWRHYY